MLRRPDARRFRPFAALSLPLAALLLLPSSVRADDVQEHFTRGVALYKQKKPDAALEEFALARKAAPNDPVILNWIGFLNLQAQKYADALEPLEAAVKANPKGAEAHLNLGNVYDGLKRYNDAAREFKRVADLQPKNADPLYNLGSVYYKMDRLPDSIAAYRAAAVLSPNDAYIQNDLGSALQKSGNLAAAMGAYDKATKLLPANAAFQLNLGVASLAQARKLSKPAADTAYAAARTALSRAVELDPRNYAIRETYGEALFELGKDADAVGQFEQASKLDTTQFNPVYNLAIAQERQGKTAEAVVTYAHALELRPGDDGALLNLGLAQVKLQQYDEAVKTLTTLTTSTPQNPTAWMGLSTALQKKGDAEGAIAALESGVKNGGKGPKVAGLRRVLASRYFNRGDADSLKKAQEQYTLALQDAADSPDALNGLGLIAQKQGKPDDAVTYFKRAVALNPRFADAYNNLGVAYEAQNNTDAALDAYRKALKADPKNATARKNLDRFEKK